MFLFTYLLLLQHLYNIYTLELYAGIYTLELHTGIIHWNFTQEFYANMFGNFTLDWILP